MCTTLGEKVFYSARKKWHFKAYSIFAHFIEASSVMKVSFVWWPIQNGLQNILVLPNEGCRIIFRNAIY